MRLIGREAIVVGAGLAGLHAARVLHLAGVDVVVIEARDRLGGRIFSADHAGQPSDDGFDLGPSWYWPHAQPAIAVLVQQLGLAAFAQASHGDVIFERMSREPPQRYRGQPQDHPAMRLVGGSAALVRALARDLPSERIVLGTRAAAIALADDGVELTAVGPGGRTTTLVANHVIAALPPRLLEATVAFTPAQDAVTAMRWRATPTWMAPHAKFFALYERAFWRDAGLSGTAHSVVGPMAEIHDATTASGSAALFGFLGVGAEQRAGLSQPVVTRACVDQLARLFGPDGASRARRCSRTGRRTR
jgi:monoamine oxidase